MRKFLILILLAGFSGCGPKDPGEVLARVDSRIYYPQEEGLTGLFCQVQSPSIEEMFRKVETEYPAGRGFLSQIKVETRFYWKRGAGARFVIKGLPEQPSSLRDSVWHFFWGTDLLMIPPKEEDQFKGMSVSLKRDKGKLELIGVNPDSKAELKQYALVVKPWGWAPLERIYRAGNYTSYSRPGYQFRTRKRYPVTIETTKKMDSGMELKSRLEIEYQDLQGFLLVKRVRYQERVSKTGEQIVPPREVIFENCRINPPMPMDIFATQDQVSFINPLPAPGSTLSPEKAPLKTNP